jgi:hypothetical protein
VSVTRGPSLSVSAQVVGYLGYTTSRASSDRDVGDHPARVLKVSLSRMSMAP